MTPTIEVDLKNILLDIAKEKGFEILEFEVGQEDHIHLLVSAHPKYPVTTLVKWLKGISSRKLFLIHKELNKSYWKYERDRQLWSKSYFVESIGFSNEEVIKKYINNQKKK